MESGTALCVAELSERSVHLFKCSPRAQHTHHPGSSNKCQWIQFKTLHGSFFLWEGVYLCLWNRSKRNTGKKKRFHMFCVNLFSVSGDFLLWHILQSFIHGAWLCWNWCFDMLVVYLLEFYLNDIPTTKMSYSVLGFYMQLFFYILHHFFLLWYIWYLIVTIIKMFCPLLRHGSSVAGWTPPYRQRMAYLRHKTPFVFSLWASLLCVALMTLPLEADAPKTRLYVWKTGGMLIFLLIWFHLTWLRQ